MNEYDLYVIPLDNGYELRISKACVVHNSASLAEGYAFHDGEGHAVAPMDVPMGENDKAMARIQAFAILGLVTQSCDANRFNSGFVRTLRNHAIASMEGWKV